MAFLIDQLNNSGLFAQSAYSAGIATCDSDGNIITATYLTGVDLTPYQTTAGMTAYATTGDVENKLDTTAFSDVSGTFLTAHQSLDGYATTAWVDSQGYLTAHQPISADEWNNVYDTVNVYSGSWTGSESSPTASVDSNGSIDIVSSNNTVYFDVNGTWFNNAVNSALPTSAAQWNSNYDTVNANSGVWGGSALPISAGPGIKVDLVDNTLVFRNDETVLWSGNLSETNFSAEQNFSESITNFERVRFNWKIDGYCGSVECPANSGILSVPYFWKIAAGYVDIRLTISANGDKWKFNDSIKWLTSTGSYSVSQFSHNWTYSMIPVREIIGINRINNV